jgi:hypothetical protein
MVQRVVADEPAVHRLGISGGDGLIGIVGSGVGSVGSPPSGPNR